MLKSSVFSVITLVFSIQYVAGDEIQQVYSYADFKSRSTGLPNVVLLLTAQNCPPCPPVVEQVKENCLKRPNVNCFFADIGDHRMTNSFYDTGKTLKVAFIPYVAFFKDGNRRAAANQRWADQNNKNVNAGFRLFK